MIRTKPFIVFCNLMDDRSKIRHEEVMKMNIEWMDENLIEATYLFCYKKIGNSQDAEDVTQGIMLEAIKAIRKGKPFVSFYSWFWAMAKNQVNMFFRMKRFNAVELDSVEGVLEAGERPEDDLIKSEEMRELNYSISRLSHLHREVIIMYYLRKMKITDIARALDVPEGTVKGRLHDAKSEIKKGIEEMQNNTGRSSYAPAELMTWGSYGIPKYWNDINDIMTKQMFVVCANEPKSLREISEEIGVAPVYFEEKLRYLLENKFIKESSKGRYLTDFLIYPKQAYSDYRAAISDIYDTLGSEATEILHNYEKDIRSIGFYGNDMPFGTLLWLLYYFAAWAMQIVMSVKNNLEWRGKVPESNGKDYRITGTVTYPDETPVYRGKKNSVNWSNLHNHFKTSGYKILEHANLFQCEPFTDRDSIINESNADLFARIYDDPFIKLTKNEQDAAAHLISLDYLHEKDGGLYLSMPVMTYDQCDNVLDVLKKALTPLCDKYYLLVSEATKRTLLPYVRADLMEEFAHWTLTGGFFPLEYMFWYGMNSEEKPLDIPEDFSNTSKAVCIYIKK